MCWAVELANQLVITNLGPCPSWTSVQTAQVPESYSWGIHLGWLGANTLWPTRALQICHFLRGYFGLISQLWAPVSHVLLHLIRKHRQHMPTQQYPKTMNTSKSGSGSRYPCIPIYSLFGPMRVDWTPAFRSNFLGDRARTGDAMASSPVPQLGWSHGMGRWGSPESDVLSFVSKSGFANMMIIRCYFIIFHCIFFIVLSGWYLYRMNITTRYSLTKRFMIHDGINYQSLYGHDMPGNWWWTIGSWVIDIDIYIYIQTCLHISTTHMYNAYIITYIHE